MTLRTLALSIVSTAALGVGVGFAQAPSGVTAALGVLNRVVGHTQRLIDAGNFARLPHEDGEFKEGVEALEHAIAGQPAEFKQKVEPLIQQAQTRSHALAAGSVQKDAGALHTAHDALADAVRTLIAAFPEDQRPAAPAPSASGSR